MVFLLMVNCFVSCCMDIKGWFCNLSRMVLSLFNFEMGFGIGVSWVFYIFEVFEDFGSVGEE